MTHSDNKGHGTNAPCWPHEPCYQGIYLANISSMVRLNILILGLLELIGKNREKQRNLNHRKFIDSQYNVSPWLVCWHLLITSFMYALNMFLSFQSIVYFDPRYLASETSFVTCFSIRNMTSQQYFFFRLKIAQWVMSVFRNNSLTFSHKEIRYSSVLISDSILLGTLIKYKKTVRTGD